MPVVWEISALHLANKMTLFSGVILTNVPYSFDKNVGGFSNLLKISRSYFINSYANKNISITSNGTITNTITDKNGSFRVVTDSLHEGEIKINISDNAEPLRILQAYPVTFKNTQSAFDVISDIDDTIIVSNTADLFKRLVTLAFKAPQKRKSISFSKKMFDEFKKLDVRVFYISKSESNLFGYLTAFIEHNGLPKCVLFLTPYLKFRQLFYPKGVDFKIDHIRFLIEHSGSKNFVLFGDDSQRDIEIYSEIAKTYPQRILKIYIRQTKAIILPHQKRMMEKFDSAGVPIKYFKSDDSLELLNELI